MIDNIPNDFCHQGECHTIVDASKTLIQQTIKRCGFKWVNYSRNSGTAQVSNTNSGTAQVSNIPTVEQLRSVIQTVEQLRSVMYKQWNSSVQ